MENERAEYVFGLLERAVVNEQRCPTNPEFAALLQKRGYRAAGGHNSGVDENFSSAGPDRHPHLRPQLASDNHFSRNT